MAKRPDVKASASSGPRGRRVLGYARVSSAAQALGTSLEDQRKAIAAYVHGLGLRVATFYTEAESAVHEKIERREQMQQLMHDAREGDLVVCDKLDRWSRDPEFTYRSLRELRERGASFYAVGDQCDPSTSEGDTMLSVRVMVAREEHKRIKERMVGTRKRLRDAGYYSEGLPPLGYVRSAPVGVKDAGKNVLKLDPTNAAKVRDVFRLCVAGASVRKICKVIDLPQDRVGRMLRSRIYVGEIQDAAGRWIRGKHPAIVDAATFQRAAEALDGRKLGGARPRDRKGAATDGWTLRDVARCGRCGARMSASYAGKREGGVYPRHYYRCAKDCGAAYVPVAAVEAAAEGPILRRLAELKDALGQAPKPTRKPTATEAAAVEDKRARLQRKRARFLEAFGDGLMSRDELRVSLGKLDAAGLSIDAAEQSAHANSPLADDARRRAALRSVVGQAKAWARADGASRRVIVRHLAHAAKLTAGKPPVFSWRSAEELAEDASE